MKSQPLSLYELNHQIKAVIQGEMATRYWVRAEISEARANYASGHCYLELVEKEVHSGAVIAKSRAMIHANIYRMLKPYFESKTGQTFGANIKVLVEVSTHFHELYGLSLSIHDIDPTYTLGDMARHRQEVLQQLAEDGVVTMNRELKWPQLPRRIAVISSPTAAGYGDFVDQLNHNSRGYKFYTHLFPAIMQGAQTEESVIAALDQIYNHQEYFDVVVIIRGGGATSDLSCFDSYLLALNIAQFPLPVVTGIGHDRDQSVADCVAAVAVKTPTAAAEHLITSMQEADNHLEWLQGCINNTVSEQLNNERERLRQLTQRIPITIERRVTSEKLKLEQLQLRTKQYAHNKINTHQQQIQQLGQRLSTLIDRRIALSHNQLGEIKLKLQQSAPRLIERERERVTLLERTIELTSPISLLKRGYTLTLKNGKVVKLAEELNTGDEITTLFADGERISVVFKPTKK